MTTLTAAHDVEVGQPGRGRSSYTYLDLTVSVASEDSRALAWLDHFMRPWFEDGDGRRGGACLAVKLSIGEPVTVTPGSRADLAACYLLDTRVVAHPVVRRDATSCSITDMELGVTYEVDQSGRIEIVTATDSPGARVALMRVVRELAMLDASARARPVIHGAVVAIGRRAVAICGPKGSGKTSMLLNALLTPTARFVANDRAIVSVVGGAVTARGLPTIVALKPGTLELFPSIAPRIREAPNRHWLTPDESRGLVGRPWRKPEKPIDLAPADFCNLMGVESLAQAALAAVVFPRIDPQFRGVDLTRLNRAAALERLSDSTVGAHLADRRADAFAVGVLSASPDMSSRADDGTALLAELPCFDVRLGRDAYSVPGLPDAIARLLD